MLTVGFSQSGQGVINGLNMLVELGLMPRTLRADNGPEFTCKALQIWAEERGVVINHPSRQTNGQWTYGKLQRKAAGAMPFNQHIFATLGDAREKIEMWRQNYNQTRPRGAPGWLMPAAYREKNINRQPEYNLKLV